MLNALKPCKKDYKTTRFGLKDTLKMYLLHERLGHSDLF